MACPRVDAEQSTGAGQGESESIDEQDYRWMA